MVSVHGVMVWALLGTFYLGWLTYQDFTNNMYVDDRKNYFMLGLSISLLGWFDRSIVYLLCTSAIVFLFRYISSKYLRDDFGEGDVSAFVWVFTGLSIINPFALLYFLGLLTVFLLVYFVLKKTIFKYSSAIPFFGVILLDFVCICALFSLYW